MFKTNYSLLKYSGQTAYLFPEEIPIVVQFKVTKFLNYQHIIGYNKTLQWKAELSTGEGWIELTYSSLKKYFREAALDGIN